MVQERDSPKKDNVAVLTETTELDPTSPDSDRSPNYLATAKSHSDGSSLDTTAARLDSDGLKPIDTTTKKEVVYIGTNTVPVLITFAFQYIIQIMNNVYFASKLGPEYTSAASLSITVFYLLGPVLFNGFSTAMDTLCSTAYGAHNYEKVGEYYLKCTLILLVCLVPLTVVFVNGHIVFSLITDDPHLVDLCSQFFAWVPFFAPAVVIFECSKRFLQSQTKFAVPTRFTIVGLPISFFLNYKLLPIMGFDGPPVALIITYWFMAISILLYIFFVDGYQCLCRHIDSHMLFTDWGLFFSLGIPGVLMILSESFAFMLLTFMAARFGVIELAAQSVVSTLASFAFNLPFSAGICCATRTANIIGERSKNYVVALPVMLYTAAFFSIFNFTWMALFRYPLARQFAKEPELIHRIAQLFLVVGFNQFLDCFNIIGAAILRGQGRQKLGSCLSLFSYYIVATPFELLFGFYFKGKVLGLWMGLAVGVGFLSISEILVILKSDWPAIIRKNDKYAA